MRKSFFRAVLILLIGGGAVSAWLYNQFYGSAVDAPMVITVSNEDINMPFDDFVETAILPNIDHDLGFKFYAKYLNLDSSLKEGEYKIAKNSSVIDIVRTLKLAGKASVNVTFNNVRTPAELAGRISHQIDVDSVDMLSYLSQPQVAEQYGFTQTTLFAMFIPNTYELYRNTTAEEFVARMAKEYKNFWSDERKTKAKARNLSQTEVMTLASIVYEETKQTAEMARVAGVYLNRLRIGMPLQADPTVKYAVGDFTIKRVLKKHLEVDSPYNTYKYNGLPPSPIAMPSIAAIDAVLDAEEHSYLYFCARPTFDGYHNFAKTLSEHNRNAQAYIRELNRLKIK